MGPARTIPAPPPTAVMAATTPTPVATRSWGNSSRMMPKARGRTAAPMPWMARATMSTTMDCASPASADPTARARRVTTSIRSLPTMSPTRPRMGVKTDADSKKTVTTQVTVDWVVWRSSWMVLRTGVTSDWSRA